jgi:type IV secretion system protein VirB4
MATFIYRGDDLGSASPQESGDLARRVNDALKTFDAGWMFHFTSERRPAVGYPGGSHFSDATSAIIDEVRRISYEQTDKHFVNDYFIDITYLPPDNSKRNAEAFLIDNLPEVGPEFVEKENQKVFEDRLRAFQNLLGSDLNLERIGVRTIEEDDGPIEIDDQLSHLIKCATNRDIQIAAPPIGTELSHAVACEKLYNGFTLRIGRSVASVMTITDMPNYSYPNMFEGLNQLSDSYRVSWRFIVRDPVDAIRDIEIERGKWHSRRRGAIAAIQGKEGPFQNSDALEMAADANQAADEARAGKVTFGYYTMSIVIWEKIHEDEDERGTDALARLTKIQENLAAYIHRLHFQTYYEKENVLEAFLGTLPGIGHAQLRKPMLSSRNLADFVPLTASYTGSITAPCPFYPPGSPPLAYVSTNGSTPYAMNVHSGDVGHFMITGETGAGKSVFLGFMLAQHRRYAGSRQIVLDVDRSHYTLCKAVGGTHYEVGGDDGVAFCPLAHIDEPLERQWAEGFIGQLLALRGVDPIKKRAAIFKALEAFAKAGPPYSLTNFIAMPYLDDQIIEALSHYTVSGNSGGVLDAEEDTIDASDFLCFEMRGLMDADVSIKQPVLTFLLRYMERLCTGRPTMLVLEEVWTFLDNEQAAQAIKRWLKTLRKANVAVGFANQSLQEFISSPLADTLLGSCPTKIFLSNPDALSEVAARAYTKIGLTRGQIAQIARGTKKSDYYITSPEGKRMVSLDLTSVELAFIGVSGKRDVPEVRRLVEEERKLLALNPNPPLGVGPDKHLPWQSVWIAHKVGGTVGQGWAKRWIELWQAFGGYSRDFDQ